MNNTQGETEIPVNHAVSIVIFASALGGAVGYLFTVHLLEPLATDLEAVWVTTVTFAVIGLYLWGIFGRNSTSYSHT